MRYSLPVSIRLFITLIILLFSSSNTLLEAEPFLKIDEINTDNFPKVKVIVTVKDPGKNIKRGLDEGNISLYEDNFLVNYVRIKNISETDAPLHIVITIDSSKSISAELLDKIKKSANEFLGRSASRDLISLYRFNDKVVLLNNFTSNRIDLVKNINKINRHGSNTLLYNALYDSVDILSKIDSTQKAVIVFTDGKDEGSSITIDDVIHSARDARIPVFCIAWNPKGNEKSLSRISKLTGGVLYNSNKKNISDIYDIILTAIKNQYVAEYKSMIEPDDKAHTIEARLKYDNIKDRDSKEIKIKKQIPFINFTYDNELLLMLLLIFLIIMLIIFIVTLKRVSKAVKTKVKECEPEEYRYRKVAGKPSAKADEIKGTEEVCAESSETTIIQEEKRKEISDMKAWLVERDSPDAGRKIPILYDEIVIGRNSGNDIIIDDRSAAGEHAKIKFIKNSFYLFDLASGKGTFLNENKLLRPKLLYDWDEIKIGKKVYIFRISNVA
ncbi:MAG: VWA domain-containing protein [Spirochaetes bacterium]|nr:VWA domain-containing protein [Spirochaetota bacterium]